MQASMSIYYEDRSFPLPNVESFNGFDALKYYVNVLYQDGAAFTALLPAGGLLMRVLCRLFHATKAFRLKQAYFPIQCLVSPGIVEVVRHPEYFLIM